MPVDAQMGLLSFKMDQFSQNGEDGIVERIFCLIGAETRTCCEFGAWDGICLSNTRRLLLEGWSGLLIEADPKRFKKLKDNYSGNAKVKCLRKSIGNAYDLESALSQNGFLVPLDILVIDIDGLDYYILERLKIRPRVICVEVNAGHSPESDAMLPRDLAAKNIGQPLAAFCRSSENLGYALIAFNGNAFLLRNDITHPLLPELDPVTAYAEYVESLDKTGRRWMYLVNRGLVPPYFKFRNDYLSADELNLGAVDLCVATFRCMLLRSRGLLCRCA
jgi:hypothetical protein